MQGTMIINREKTKKIFRFFLKKACFSSSWLQKLSKFLAIKEVLHKKPHHFWNIGRRAIFRRIYLNFKISDENWLFFRKGGSAKKHGTVYFLMFPIHSIIRVVLYGSLLASNIYWKYENSRGGKYISHRDSNG